MIKKDKEQNEKVITNNKLKQYDLDLYYSVQNIKKISTKNKSIITSMGSTKKLPFSFELIHFLPAQVSRIPLESTDNVNTSITIGPSAKKPLKLFSPIMISGMSLGTVSIKVKKIFQK